MSIPESSITIGPVGAGIDEPSQTPVRFKGKTRGGGFDSGNPCPTGGGYGGGRITGGITGRFGCAVESSLAHGSIVL